MAPILPVNLTIPAIQPISSRASAGAATGAAFQSVLNDAVEKVETFGQNASTSVNNFLSGEGEELHDLALKTQQAELSFDLFLQARNKVISAYQEIMRMQV